MRALFWLHEITEDDHGRVGGKAFVLGRLRQAGFPVPDGFVIAATAKWGAAEQELAARSFRTLGGPVAVRSSGTAEDGAAASFAGQYLTVLDVKDEAQLLDAIARCRASASRAGTYAAALGAAAGSMAVLVQRFIEPRAAGVVFTRDPRDGARALVEAFAGRGEELVSGRVTPARYSVDAGGRATSAGGGEVLTPAEAAELAALARRVEAHLGTPQDVEWAWDGAGIAVVQARPITVALPEAIDPRVRRLTRANVGEVLPGPVTPLTHSAVRYFLEEVFRRISARLAIAPEDPPPFLVLHHRHLYFNLDLCIDIATRLGAPPQDAERLILGGGATAGQGTKFGRLPRWRTVMGGLAISRELVPRVAEAEALVAAVPGPDAIAAASSSRLVQMLDDLTAGCLEVAFTHVTTSGASAMTMSLLAALLARDGHGDAMERTGRLLAGLDGVDSVAPAVALEEIAAHARADGTWRAWIERPAAEAAAAFARRELPAAFAAELEGFLRRFGHRGVAEGDLSARSWDEDPAPVFESLQALMRSGRTPGFGSRARAEIRRADEEALLSRAGPLRRALLGHAVASAQAWVRRREHTKSLLVASIHHGRRLVQAAGRHLAQRGALPEAALLDFLTWEEIRAGLAGGDLPLAGAQRRRRAHLRESRLPVPRELDLGRPEPVAAATAAPTDVLRGIGVSAGVAVGRARVIHSPDGSLQPGEILVTPVLDAGLAPLLATAAGAVAEIGGILSHGSVVAREMGVPCVVDARDATRWIADGERIVVDGSTGTITRVPEVGGLSEASVLHTPVLSAAGDDELALHALEDHPRARESVYLNMRDAARGLAVVFSMAVRPGGRGEALLTLSLPDGRVLFAVEMGRARVDAGGFRVGGFRLDWRPLRLTLDAAVAPHESASFPPGPLPLLAAPRTVRVRGTLTLEPTTSAVDFCALLPPEAREWLRPLGSHHVEQSGRWRGTLNVDGRATPFEGRGSRDHSWGRREWAAADYWRLFMAPISDRLAVHALITSTRGRLVTGGVLWRDGRAEAVSRVEYAARRDAAGKVRAFELELTTASGAARLQGDIEHTVPIPVDPERRLWRHLVGRPYALVLHENFTRYEIDGEVGHGMAEITERPL